MSHRGRAVRTIALPAAVVTAVAAGAALAWDVTGSELVRFAAFELLAVIAPGLLAWWALSGERAITLRGLCVGSALGHAILIGAFALTAAIDLRDWLPAAIAAVAVTAGAVVVARRTGGGFDGSPPLPRGWGWAVGGAAVIAVAYLVAGYFTQTPLPGDADKVSYYQDYVFHLSLSAEALHHWPIGEPKVSGEPLAYQTFFYMQIAGTSEVTDIGLPVLLLRLVPLGLLLLVSAQAAWAARELSGRAWAGPIAVVLLILVGELDPSTGDEFVFYNTFFFSLHTSPTFLLGLAFFIPALVISAELAGAAPRSRSGAGLWVALGVLLLASAGTKATILPVLVGGLAIYAVVVRALEKRTERNALAVAALAGLIFVATFALFYEGGSGGLRFDPPASIERMIPIALAESRFDGTPVIEQLFWVVATPIGILGFCVAPALGLAWLLRRPLRALSPIALLLLSSFVASVVPFLLLSHPGGSQNFFTYYGYVALALLSAGGIAAMLEKWLGRSRAVRRREAGAALAVVAATLVLAALVGIPDGPSDSRRYLAWFGVPLVVLGLAALLLPRHRRTGWLAAGLALAALTYGALDTPIDVGTPLVERDRDGEPSYPTAGPGLTRDLDEGLEWLRENSPEDSVIAVSNYWTDDDQDEPFFSYYSALAERRVFLEGWGYTLRTADLGPERVIQQGENPYPDRFADNEAVFRDANQEALDRLLAQGVDHLVADLANSEVSPELGNLGELVYSNPDVAIYAVSPEARSRHSGGSSQAQTTAASSPASLSSPSL